ncbi:MAG: 3-phosphoshikimate 1-carboxyvinyltransferase [Clostridia bacterium]|nr:3-phosphoshikimate 1-carboxyvinyltransferase [Clostridia bacterium]
MKMIIEHRSSLKGEISVPGDKSISHRAIMFGALAMGTTEIDNFLMGEDCLSTIDCFRKMQVGIEILPHNKVRVNGNGLFGLKPPSSQLNAGKAGTTLRLLLGVLSGQPFNSVVTRDDSAIKKPVGKVVAPLRQMGASISGKEDGNLCPLLIYSSKLNGIKYDIPVHASHIKSPLIIAGMYADGETTVTESIKSRDHTELMLQYFGADIKVDGLSVTSKRIENLYARHIEVPGDISIAAYFLTAGLITQNSDITIRNVGVNPTRTGILDIFKSMGAKIQISNVRFYGNEKVADISVSSSDLKAVAIDGEIIPRLIDEIPVIAVAAALAEGTSIISGLKGYKIKDSNRIRLLCLELSKMGASVQETEDGMIIEGGKPLKGTVIETYNDNAIAMAMSVAALAAEGETMIRKSQCVDLAFPDFYPILKKL